MKLNINFDDFMKNHKNKKNQILYATKKCFDYSKVENLFRFLSIEENSFIFTSPWLLRGKLNLRLRKYRNAKY